MSNNEFLKLIRRKEVENLTGLSRSRIYALIQENKFPKPISLGQASVAWISNEIQNWIHEKINESRRGVKR